MFETEKSRRPTSSQCLSLLNEIDNILKKYLNKMSNINMNNSNCNEMCQEFEKWNYNFNCIIEQNEKNKKKIEIKNIKLITSMKCLFHFFYLINNMNPIMIDIGDKKNMYNLSNNTFISIFHDMFKNVFLKESRLIGEDQYNENINNFIIKLFNQKNKQNGVRPIILYYNILNILNNEFDKYANIFKYNITIFNNYVFALCFKDNLWPPMFNMIEQYKKKLNNPLIYNFSFFLFSIYKCPFCGKILRVLPGSYKFAYFLQLDVNPNDQDLNITKLLNNKFCLKKANYFCICPKCGLNITAAEQQCMMNSPNYLVMELVDQYSIKVETLLNIGNFKASNEGPHRYELFAVIYYQPDIREYGMSNSSVENNWSKIPGGMTFNSPSMVIYRKIGK
jgi:hypothetical protein